MGVVLEWSESPAPNPKLRELIKAWLDANLSDHPATATRQRGAARSVVEAIETAKLDHERLPPDFLKTHWFPKHGGNSRVTQNVLLALAGKMLDHLRSKGCSVPAQLKPELAPPPSKVKKEKVPARAAVVDVDSEADDASAEEAPPASVAPRPAPVLVQQMTEPPKVVVKPAVHSNPPPPPVREESSMPSAFTFPEAPAANAEPKRGRPANPVAALIPPENRLRIYKKGEPGQLDAHLIDMPAALVARYGTGAGAIVTILNDVVRPKWGPRPGERATYRLVQVSPQNAEGNGTEAVLEGEALPLPTPVPPVVPGQPAVLVPTHDQLAALQAQQAQAQAALDQLQALQAQRGAGTDAQLDANLRALQEQVGQLQAQLQSLSLRPAGPGDFGTAALGAVTGMVDKLVASRTAPVQDNKQPTMMELLQYAQQQADRQRQADREFFALMFKKEEAPKVDPMLTALLERMDARLAALEESQEDDEPTEDDGLSGIKKFMEVAEFLKKNMGIEAGPTMRAKEPENVLGLLRELLTQAPAIIAEYRQTIPTVAAARLGMVQPVPAALPAQPGQPAAQPAQPQQPMTPEQQQAAARAKLPPDVRAAVERLLAATTDDQVGDAVSALVTQMEQHAGNNPQARNVFEKLEQGIVAGELDNTVMRLRQIFVFFGYGAEAPVPKVVELAKTVIRLVKMVNDHKAQQVAQQAAPAEPAQPAEQAVPAEASADTEEDAEEDTDEDEEEGDEGEDEEDEDADEEEDAAEEATPAALPPPAAAAPAVPKTGAPKTPPATVIAFPPPAVSVVNPDPSGL